MALDTRGLASGFQSGFGMMDQYYRGQAQDRRAEEDQRMQRETFDMKKDEVTRARDLEQIQMTFGKIANGMGVSDEELQTLQKYPRFWSALNPETDKALAQAEKVVNPEDPADINDPESIEALNTVFGADVNKGDGGQKRIAAAVPGPDGQSLMFELDVDPGEEGQRYRAPMTEGRGTNPDDSVKAVPLDGVVQQVSGVRALRRALQTPGAQAQATKLYNLLTGNTTEQWETVEGPDGAMFQRNARTGEMKSLIGRKPRGSSYQNRPTTTMRDIEYMVSTGVAPDRETAFEMLNNRAGADNYDRGRDEIRYLSDRLEEIESMRTDAATWRRMPEDERQAILEEREELRARRDDVAGSLYNSSSGGLDTSGRPEPEPEPEPEPKRQPSRAAPKAEPAPQREEPKGTLSEQGDALLKSLGL